MEIFYCRLLTPLGEVEISGSKYAIHAVRFEVSSDSESRLLPPLLIRCRQELQEYFEGKRKVFSVNCEQAGTDFQKLVWKKIQQVPFGKTLTYGQLAHLAGDRKAARATGHAVAKNRIPIIIPCHRIIGCNDELTGYTGGLWRKQWLLDHEYHIAHGIQRLF
jgi:methylated-DNA-[protein]-cysteine S-methyltransferase